MDCLVILLTSAWSGVYPDKDVDLELIVGTPRSFKEVVKCVVRGILPTANPFFGLR